MKLIESIKQIISEASKKKILMDKIGFNEDNADLLDKLCGPLSVWMGNKMMEYQQQFSASWGHIVKQGEELITQMNTNRFIDGQRSKIQSVMDWIRVGLNGNVKEYQNLPFDELYSKSKEFNE